MNFEMNLVLFPKTLLIEARLQGRDAARAVAGARLCRWLHDPRSSQSLLLLDPSVVLPAEPRAPAHGPRRVAADWPCSFPRRLQAVCGAHAMQSIVWAPAQVA